MMYGIWCVHDCSLFGCVAVDQMASTGINWHQLASDRILWFQLFRIKRDQTGSNGIKWHSTDQLWSDGIVQMGVPEGAVRGMMSAEGLSYDVMMSRGRGGGGGGSHTPAHRTATNGHPIVVATLPSRKMSTGGAPASSGAGGGGNRPEYDKFQKMLKVCMGISKGGRGFDCCV